MKKVALIILNYNSYEDTVNCVDKIISFNDKNIIPIIVDNKSTDDSLKLINDYYKDKKVDIVYADSNKGYSAGNNLGIRYSIDKYHAEVVGIVNPDVLIPDSSVINELVNALYLDPSYAIAGAMVANIKHEITLKGTAWKIPSKKNLLTGHMLLSKGNDVANTYPMLGKGIMQVDCVAGCFFLAKTDLFANMGYLDENVFLYNEENILGIKCKRNGYKEILVTSQMVFHNHKSKSNKKMPLKKKLMASKNSYISRKYLCKTYYSKGLLPALAIIEGLNRIYLFGCYIKNVIFNNN